RTLNVTVLVLVDGPARRVDADRGPSRTAVGVEGGEHGSGLVREVPTYPLDRAREVLNVAEPLIRFVPQNVLRRDRGRGGRRTGSDIGPDGLAVVSRREIGTRGRPLSGRGALDTVAQ